MTFTGCSKSVMYSEKYEGIPLYPGIELNKSTEYTERYKILEFKGTFTEVKEFYMKYINQEIWDVEENPLQWNQENSFVGEQGYTLKDGEREVSLVIQRQKINKEDNGYLYIIINGSPCKEGKYKVEGENKHWKVSLEYIITKERIRINGDAQYIENSPPNEVECEFVYYQNMENQMVKGSSRSVGGETLEDSKINLDGGYNNREYEIEILKKAINNAYIEIKWKEHGEDKIEKIDLNIVDN